MNYQTKRKVMNGIVYGVLALTVVAIIAITIITLVTSGNKPVTPEPSVEPPQTTSVNQPPKTTSSIKTPTAKPTPTPVATPTPTPEPTPSPTPTIPSNNDDPIVFSLPATGYVMKEYSTDLPVFSLTMGDYRTHSGIDISVAAGSSVVSVADGTISRVYSHPMMGTTIEIDHGEGLKSIYSNLDDDIVEGIAEGVTVGGGQLIGSVGFTSLAEIGESDHLHFEMTVDGKNVDPLSYLDFSSIPKEDVPGNE